MTLERIAEARILIDQARWLVLNAAYMMDTVGNTRCPAGDRHDQGRRARRWRCQVIDWAIQMHGGGGVSDDFRWRRVRGRAHAAAGRRPGRSAPSSRSASWSLARYRARDSDAWRMPLTRQRKRKRAIRRHFKLLRRAHSRAASAECRRPTNLSTTPKCRPRAIPDKPFLVFYDTPVSFAEFRTRPSASRVSRAANARCASGDRVLLYMQNSPQFIIGLLRHSARERGRGAGQSHEPDAGDGALRRGCGATHGHRVAGAVSRASSRCSASPAGPRARDRRDVFGLSEAADRLAVPEFVAAPRKDSPAPGVTPWREVLASGAAARAAHRRSGRPVRDALYVRHHRRAEGLHAYPSQRHAHAGRRHALVLVQPETTLIVGGAVLSRDRHAGRHERPDLSRATRWSCCRAGIAMRRRECMQRYRDRELDRDPDHDSGFLVEPEDRQVRPVARSGAERRRRGNARRGRAAAARQGVSTSKATGCRRPLRPRTSIRRISQAAMPGHSDLRRGLARHRSRSRCGNCPPAKPARSSCTGRRCSWATGTTPRTTAEAFIEIDGKRFLRTGDLGQDRRGRLFLHGRSPQAHDQRLGIQGLARRSRVAHVPASRDSRGLRHRRHRCASRRDGQGGGGAAAGLARRDHAQAIIAGAAKRWRPTKAAGHRVRRRTPKSGRGKICGASCRSAKHTQTFSEGLTEMKALIRTRTRRGPQNLASRNARSRTGSRPGAHRRTRL